MQARAGLYANNLPSNQELPNDVTEEALQRGWTVQQPYIHATSTVAFVCILCGEQTDQRDWVTHECLVQELIGGQRPWTARI